MYIYVYTYIKEEERGGKNEGSTEQAYAEKSFRQTGYKEVLPYSRIRCYKSRSLPAFSCPLAKSPSPHSVRRINLRSQPFSSSPSFPINRSVLSILGDEESSYVIDSRITRNAWSVDTHCFTDRSISWKCTLNFLKALRRVEIAYKISVYV